jgi:hypothetical protein
VQRELLVAHVHDQFPFAAECDGGRLFLPAQFHAEGRNIILRDTSFVNEALHGFPHACLFVFNHSLYFTRDNVVQSLLECYITFHDYFF